MGINTNLDQTRWPILALRNLVLVPGMTVPIRVGRLQSMLALKRAQEMTSAGSPTQLVVTLQNLGANDDQSALVKVESLHQIGVICEIEKSKGSETDGYQLLIKGLERVRLLNISEDASTHLLEAEVEVLADTGETGDYARLLTTMKEAARDLVQFLPNGQDQIASLIEEIEDLRFLTYATIANLDISIGEKQRLLEIDSLADRASSVIEVMAKVRSELQVKSEIRDKLHSKLGKSQRDAILREQMKAIREELGDERSDSDRLDDYREKISKSKMPEETRKIALDELKRLESMNSQSPETHVIRNYLDLLLALPWAIDDDSTPPIDIAHARESLDRDHYGLDKVKKRIIEHLATIKLRGGSRGMILLLVGPPGVGKTSLGNSIASAIGRKFVRAALGGVRDDAEIRGHRRTYVGAMAGRVIQGIKRAGVMNPVFMLDEIDKLSRGFSGDPASALLEVLDPEQNHAFHDHYLDVPYDLSKVLFIATANSLEGIPGPLLDRMEVIDLSGYTSLEKLHIARHHLLPKQLEEHGLKATDVAISDEILTAIIGRYTREAGVRTLQRQIAALCRSLAARVAERPAADSTPTSPIMVAIDDLDEIFGQARVDHEEALSSAPAGVVTGLAWTPVGGEILFVEATSMPGTGKLVLTGQLGDVMKESAQIALTLIRSRLPQIVQAIDFDKRDFHIHVPAGAIPKDGPSAGVAMVTALTSLMTGKPVSPKIAMTGEITLRGKVTPVGGVKEKIMGAHRAGVTHVIIPRKNERDLKDVPEEIKKSMTFTLADDVSDVLRPCIGLELPPQDPTTGLWGVFQAGTAGPHLT
ncbi:MAG: endopeptidase La [Bdellovibrionaceae bacterium]|nr:endopeptidase La [Pseudobdellovibrionaceae bacterium]